MLCVDNKNDKTELKAMCDIKFFGGKFQLVTKKGTGRRAMQKRPRQNTVKDTHTYLRTWEAPVASLQGAPCCISVVRVYHRYTAVKS